MKKEQIKNILATLDEMYPAEECSLDYESDWQLLFATILSAQCTDARVNIITKDLYKKYPDLKAFASADIGELEQDVKPAGYFRSKAKHIKECAGELLTRFEGKVPRTLEELTSLPGVGRKTANVIRTHIYHDDSIVVDTHVKRISQRLGLTKESDPEKIEFDLMKVIPKNYWILINIWFITFGRSTCKAQSPKCQECPLAGYCRDCRDPKNPRRHPRTA